jgi:hypothetical protein
MHSYQSRRHSVPSPIVEAAVGPRLVANSELLSDASRRGPTQASPDGQVDRMAVFLAYAKVLEPVAAFSVIGLSGVAGVITDADGTHPTVSALRKRKVPVLHAP